jgi:hypothetical protein
MGDTVMSNSEFNVGDKVRFKGLEPQYTLLAECGDFVWLQRGSLLPQTYLKDGLEKVPIIDPIYLRFYTTDGEFSSYAHDTFKSAVFGKAARVLKVSIDETGNPNAEWVNEEVT